MGAETVKYMEAAYNVTKWTLKEFAEVFVQKYLQEVGAEPEIIKKSDSQVIYRMHNCLFYELSQQVPFLMCDVIHRHFHNTLIKAMSNNFEDSQRSCMGHGATCCEHVVEWVAEKNEKMPIKHNNKETLAV